MLRFFTSIKTSVAFFVAAIFFFFAGALIIPKTMEAYTNIIDTVLFRWLKGAGLSESWWVYGIVSCMALMAVNTIVCSADALVRKLGRKDFIRTLSPQIIHLGVLLILMGHLFTSAYGLRKEVLMSAGETFTILPGIGFVVEKILVETNEPGETGWDVRGAWKISGERIKPLHIRPSRPSYHKGFWVFIKSADSDPSPRAVLMIRKDDGAYWAASGMAVFALGCAMLLYARGKTY